MGEADLSSEIAQQYIQRLTAHVERKRPLAVQPPTAKKLVPTAKLCKRPASETRSVNEILAHLADLEIIIGFRGVNTVDCRRRRRVEPVVTLAEDVVGRRSVHAS
jgi:hypothetical protein